MKLLDADIELMLGTKEQTVFVVPYVWYGQLLSDSAELVGKDIITRFIDPRISLVVMELMNARTNEGRPLIITEAWRKANAAVGP